MFDDVEGTWNSGLIPRSLKRNVEKNADLDLSDKNLKRHVKAVKTSIMVWSFRFVALIGAYVVLAYVLNITLPEERRWLEEEDLSRLSDLTISIVAGVAVNLALRVAHDD